MAYICPHCHWGYLLTHNVTYVKCSICGYTEELDQEKRKEYMTLFKTNKERGDDREEES